MKNGRRFQFVRGNRPEMFFPASPSDIHDEAAFPHEWNYGLADLGLPHELSVTDQPREGNIDFEYSERPEPFPWEDDARRRRPFSWLSDLWLK